MIAKKKILIRIGSLRHGGAEKVLVTFLKNLPAEKYEIDLLLNLYSGKYLSEVPNWINVIYLNKGEMITTNRLQDIPQKAFRVLYQKILKMFPQLLYQLILKGKKYDIEFAAIHGFRDEILESPNKKSKKIVWIHSDLENATSYNDTEEELQKFLKFDRIMTISDQIQQNFEKLACNPAEKRKIVRIYNPLDTNVILDLSLSPISDKITSLSLPTFISVGTIYPAKGFDRLIQVHKKLLQENLTHQILIVGDGYDFEKLKKLTEDLNVTDTVKLLGYKENPYPYIKNADFYILSSRYEGFPTVLFEAITLKKKIIATDVSGVREMLDNGKLGLIVENSEDGIYEGMKKALQNPEDFKNYEENLNGYQMPFNLENSVKSIIKIIDEL